MLAVILDIARAVRGKATVVRSKICVLHVCYIQRVRVVNSAAMENVLSIRSSLKKKKTSDDLKYITHVHLFNKYYRTPS